MPEKRTQGQSAGEAFWKTLSSSVLRTRSAGSQPVDPDGVVVAAAGQPVSVWTERHRVDVISVICQTLLQCAIFHAPQPDGGAVSAFQPIAGDLLPEGDEGALLAPAAGQPSSVRTECDGIDSITVAAKSSDQPATGSAPDPDGRVIAAARHQTAVRSIGHADDSLLVACHGSKERARVGSPELDHPIETPADNPLTIGTEGD